MKICHISDTHCNDFAIDTCDICIHTGDALNYGDLRELLDFKHKIERVRNKCKYFILIPGNHDLILETDFYLYKEDFKKTLNVDIYLNTTFDIEQIKFGACSYITCINHYRKFWAFETEDSTRKQFYSTLPKVDILCTHTPSSDICFFGCSFLSKYIKDNKPKYHLCGHDHDTFGKFNINNTIVYNSALSKHTFVY